MTGYYLSVGYNAKLGALQQQHAWQTLVATFQNVIDQSQRIVNEVLRVEPQRAGISSTVWQFVEAEGPAFRISHALFTAGEPEDFALAIQQLARGDGPERDVKESIRRAICRLVLEDMHRLRIEVNMRVSHDV